MATIDASDVLFVGLGKGVISWYRTGSPAFTLGCDWAGLVNRPPDLALATAVKRGGLTVPNFYDYKIIILQQVAGKEWLNEIIRLKHAGIKVFYEIDDYIHGVSKVKGHKAAKIYNKAVVAEHELCMRACSGMIVSTPWLARKYAKFNKKIWVCKNAIERRRYDYLELPERKTLNIGWAGGEGHFDSVCKWLPALEEILSEYPQSRFLSIGLDVAGELAYTEQAYPMPTVNVENYPGALCNFDISIGPADHNSFFAAKSDLRHLETGALGIPLVGDPFVYPEIIHGETGMCADNPIEAHKCLKFLIDNPDKCEEISYNVRDYVLNERSMENKGCEQWERVFVDVAQGLVR